MFVDPSPQVHAKSAPLARARSFGRGAGISDDASGTGDELTIRAPSRNCLRWAAILDGCRQYSDLSELVGQSLLLSSFGTLLRENYVLMTTPSAIYARIEMNKLVLNGINRSIERQTLKFGD
jgi:hypothetical protein